MRLVKDGDLVLRVFEVGDLVRCRIGKQVIDSTIVAFIDPAQLERTDGIRVVDGIAFLEGFRGPVNGSCLEIREG